MADSLKRSFRLKSVDDFMAELEQKLDAMSSELAQFSQRIEDLELVVELNSALLREGASFAPVPLAPSYQWSAEDLSEEIRGLDNATYGPAGVATRWARAGVNELRLYAPTEVSPDQVLRIEVDGRTRPEVIKTLKIFCNGKKIPGKLQTTDERITITAPVTRPLEGRGVAVMLRFLEVREGQQRHTLGLQSIAVG